MTNEQKKYIEKNIELIENNNWDDFFRLAPQGIGGVLSEAGIDFLFYMRDIPNSAFYRSNIQKINIPKEITSIESRAFYDCNKLTRLEIPDSVTSIGGLAFYNCSGLTSITIPENVTGIELGAFDGCSSLKSIVIPNSVTSIYEGSFNELGSDVIISFNGTKEQWKNIYNSKAFKGTYFTVNCLDGALHKKKR